MRALRPLLFSIFVLACGGGGAEPSAPKPAASAAAPPPSAAPAPAPPPVANEVAKTDAEPAPASPSAGTAPAVKVTDAGAAPRKALRYRFKAGVTEFAEMDMKMSLAMSMGAKLAPKTELPTVRTTMRIDAKEITPEGDLRCSFNADKVEVLKDVKVDAKMRESLEKELAGLVGMHGKARISTRGVTSETEFELSPNASQALNAQMDTLRDALRQMYVPFPEEEVGKGAKWEVTSRLPVSGALVDTKLTYAITKLDADGVQADVQSAIEAPPNQPMRIGALPAGATATLESMTGKGTGKVSPSFVRLVSSGANRIAMDSIFGVVMRGQQIQMKMQSEIAITIRPGHR